MHSAAKAGYLNVVRLLVESGASSTAETGNGRIPLWYAAAEGNLAVVSYLIHQNHDSYALLSDRKVRNNHTTEQSQSQSQQFYNFRASKTGRQML